MTQHSLLRPTSASEKAALKRVTSEWSVHLTEAVEYLAARGIEETDALTAALGLVAGDIPPAYRRYEGMLSIPYLDKNGDPLTVRFRRLGDGPGPKYMGLPDDPTRMYGIANIFKADDTIGITEGEFDSLLLTKLGMPAVAIPGANNWKKHHRRMLAGFSNVYVFGDPDEAGMEFNRAVAKAIPRARVVPLRDGDVTDEFVRGGKDAVWSLIEEAGR